jgi:membrane-anchored mycosin MYCP
MTDAATQIEDREILVALSHKDPVLAILKGLVNEDAIQSSDQLGLARLPLADVEKAASVLVAKLGDDEPYDKSPSEHKPALDKVLGAVRRLAKKEYANWEPVVGKNRVVSLGTTGGRISYGGDGPPRSVQQQPAWPPRSQGPGRGVRVGVLDTGLSSQQWLAGAWTARYSDLLPIDLKQPSSAGHATFVSGLVLSQAPGATVEVRRLLDEATGTATSWDAAQQIVDFGSTGLDILNLSFACFTEDGEAPMAIASAIDRLDPRLVVVAAAGNHGSESGDKGRRPAFPAALDDVVAVGSVGDDWERSAFSADKVPWIDVLAPGENVVSTFLTGTYPGEKDQPDVTFNGFAEWSGTSFSTALVTGLIAAGTVPGRVSARASWDNIRSSLQRGPDGAPPVLKLRKPSVDFPPGA